METQDYYRHNKLGTTYLELYSVPVGGTQKDFSKILTDQEAYDTWHLGLYMNEIINNLDLATRPSISLEEIPRKEKNLLVYLAMNATGLPDSSFTYCEIGSSLFEVISGLNLVNHWVRTNNRPLPLIDTSKIKFIGIEPSRLLSVTSKLIHPDLDIIVCNNADEIEDGIDLLYDRAVSSYAFANCLDLANLLNRSRIAILNLYLSKGETFVSNRLGKPVTYFSLRELNDHLQRPLYHLFGFKSPTPWVPEQPCIEGFFIYGDQELSEKFMALARSDKDINDYFQYKNIRFTRCMDLID